MENSYGASKARTNADMFMTVSPPHHAGHSKSIDAQTLSDAVQRSLFISGDAEDREVAESMKQLDPDILEAFENFSLTDDDNKSSNSNSAHAEFENDNQGMLNSRFKFE